MQDGFDQLYFLHGRQVSQKVDETGRVLAINYWYDMDYDLRYCYFR